jgi:hypothetical protein
MVTALINLMVFLLVLLVLAISATVFIGRWLMVKYPTASSVVVTVLQELFKK